MTNRTPPPAEFELESADPRDILTWAWETFGEDVAATSSFQTQSLPLLHMIATTTPDLPILFLDTGFHFPETLAYRERLTAELELSVRVLRPELGHRGFRQTHGELYLTDPDRCCYHNKVEPLDGAKADLAAWITGIRRDQTRDRAEVAVLSDDSGVWKICPMLQWTEQDVAEYIRAHDLPVHPLLHLGYPSVGCAPCTRPVAPGESSRMGRWAGFAKIECGLHNRPTRGSD
jgi:phosphoadenosine phosphosulfate reductase